MQPDHGDAAKNIDPNGTPIFSFDAMHSEHDPRDQEVASDMLGSRSQNVVRSSDKANYKRSVNEEMILDFDSYHEPDNPDNQNEKNDEMRES